MTQKTSRLPGFYNLLLRDRIEVVSRFAQLTGEEKKDFHSSGALSDDFVNAFIENAVGSFEIPFGVATNFIINSKELLIPMAVEESSVIAAASFGAKLTRPNGGFRTKSTQPIMTGQIQLHMPKKNFSHTKLAEEKKALIEYANKGLENLCQRGGGVTDINWYFIDEISSLIFKVFVHTCDAMGANIVNTICEKLSVPIAQLFPNSRLGLKILTNLCDKRVALAQCLISPEDLNSNKELGQEMIEQIICAYQFALHDPYRAATHNKGIMNGIDPVLIATGNDWRAVEAGAHAFASQTGKYRPLSKWQKTLDGKLHGSLELPIAVGTVGGVTKLHPKAQVSLKILENPTAQTLGEICCAVGLGQNLSALKALATEGIQKGHMRLHEKNLSMQKQTKLSRSSHMR